MIFLAGGFDVWFDLFIPLKDHQNPAKKDHQKHMLKILSNHLLKRPSNPPAQHIITPPAKNHLLNYQNQLLGDLFRKWF